MKLEGGRGSKELERRGRRERERERNRERAGSNTYEHISQTE